MRATSASLGESDVARRDREDGRDPEVADRNKDLAEVADDRTSAAAASGPISSAASRRAVAAASASDGSDFPGKLTSPLWCPS
jgi:hypothetical protein